MGADYTPYNDPEGSVTVEGAPLDAGYPQGGPAPEQGGGGGGVFDPNLIAGPLRVEYTNNGGGEANLNALYQQYFGRDVDPSGAATFAGQDINTVTQAILNSQEYANRGGGAPSGAPSGALSTSLDMTPEQTVNDVYRKVFGREADENAKGFIEDVRGGTGALELAQRLQTTDEGKAYLQANPDRAYKSMAALSQQNAPFQKEGSQFGYYTPQTTDSEGNITGGQFNPTIDYSGLKYAGSPTRIVGGGESNVQTVTNHQYEDGKGGTITVDDRGSMISYTPSTQWYADQQAKHPDAIRQGYRNINYLASGPLDQTINIMGQEVPVQAQEYVTNDKGQLVVDKSGNLINMIRAPQGGHGFQDIVSQVVDAGIMAAGTLGGGPIGAAAASGLVGLKNETPTNQILRNAAIAAATTYAAGQLGGYTGGVEQAGPTYGELGYTGLNQGQAIQAANTASQAATTASTSANNIPAWLQAAQKGAIVGGTMGGINAFVQGTDPLKGVGYGALTGAVGGGAGSYLGSAINPFAGNVIGGALAGTAGAAVTGQDLTRGALYGGGSGALNYGLTQSDYSPEILKNNPYLRGAVTGAAFSGLAGRDPFKGAISGAAGSYIGNQLNTTGNDLYNRTFNTSSPRADVDVSPDIRFAENQTISPETIRENAPYSPLAQTVSYNPSNDFSENLKEITRSENVVSGIVQNQDGSITYPLGVGQITTNTDGTVTAIDAQGNTQTLSGEFADNAKALAQYQAEQSMKTYMDSVESAKSSFDAQIDAIRPAPNSELDRLRSGMQPIPPDMRGYEAPNMINPLVNIGNEGAFAREPFMTNIADPRGSVTVELKNPEMINSAGPRSSVTITQAPDIPSDARNIPLPTDAQIEALDQASERASALNLSAAGPMSQPTNSQEAIALSENFRVEANATPQEQEIISQLKDIINSPDTSSEQKQVAADELKQISIAIANGEGGDLNGVEGGVKGGVDGGVSGGVLGSTGIKPGTAGGRYGDEGNFGEDKIDMPDEKPPKEEDPIDEIPIDEIPIDEIPIDEIPIDEIPEDEDPRKNTPKPSLPRQPLPIKKPIYPSQIPGYSFNQNITGALPGNLSATMLAGSPTQEGRRMLQQLKQLYPQLSSIDPDLLQTLSNRSGSGGGALSTPAPGYPDQASGKTSFAQSNMPANFSALGSAGLQALGGASNPNIAGYADGGDVHVPEFKTGTTGHYVQGRGDGQSDEIPAMLANGEYVFDADTVAALGNGSNEAGARALDKMREAIRKHKRSAPHTKIPPKAKSPLEYLKGK